MVSGSFRMSGSRRTKMTEDFAARWKKVDADGIGLDSSLDWYELGERADASPNDATRARQIVPLGDAPAESRSSTAEVDRTAYIEGG